MLYEITLATPDGTEFTDTVDLPLDPEISWNEFCEHRAFLHWKKHREDWSVIDITPEDMIKVQDQLAEPEPEIEFNELDLTAPPEVVEPVEPKPEAKPKKTQFIDSWSGRITKNVEFTRWMARAKENGISDLTFKSRVYKLKYDYERAATKPLGAQGYKQK